jgi:hypothetical protein
MIISRRPDPGRGRYQIARAGAESADNLPQTLAGAGNWLGALGLLRPDAVDHRDPDHRHSLILPIRTRGGS